jgi:hypothetical protein
MEITAIRVLITVEVEGAKEVKLTVWGWGVAIDGKLAADENGEALYVSVNPSDIRREIRRLRKVVADQLRRDQQEEEL